MKSIVRVRDYYKYASAEEKEYDNLIRMYYEFGYYVYKVKANERQIFEGDLDIKLKKGEIFSLFKDDSESYIVESVTVLSDNSILYIMLGTVLNMKDFLKDQKDLYDKYIQRRINLIDLVETEKLKWLYKEEKDKPSIFKNLLELIKNAGGKK